MIILGVNRPVAVGNSFVDKLYEHELHISSEDIDEFCNTTLHWETRKHVFIAPSEKELAAMMLRFQK